MMPWLKRNSNMPACVLRHIYTHFMDEKSDECANFQGVWRSESKSLLSFSTRHAAADRFARTYLGLLNAHPDTTHRKNLRLFRQKLKFLLSEHLKKILQILFLSKPEALSDPA